MLLSHGDVDYKRYLICLLHQHALSFYLTVFCPGGAR